MEPLQILTVIMTYIAYFSILLCTVSGIKLPGLCPNVPVTHDLDNTARIYPYIIYRIPLMSENPSYFFRELSVPMIGKAYLRSLSLNNGTYLISEVSRGVKTTYRLHSEAVRNNNTITITSHISDVTELPMLCYPNIVEEIRIWYVGDFVFIWSCVEYDGSKEHDEALIILVNFKVLHLNHYPIQKTQVLLNAAQGYISGTLLEKVNFSYPENLWTGANEDRQFHCRSDIKTIIPVTIVILLIGSIVTIFLWKKERKRLNRVSVSNEMA